jgi:sulfide:quinone oxidoreductase
LTEAQVVIVGAGVAGTIAANRLAGRARVTVLNNYDDHLNQPAFLYMALGRRFRIAAPERNLLRPGVRFRVARVRGLDPDRRVVQTEDGESIRYDYLLLATGSRLREREVPGFWEGAHHFHCRHAAERLSTAVAGFGGGRIVVGAWSLPYKCPPSPHEFIFLLDDQLRRDGRRSRSHLTFVYPLAQVFSKPAVIRMIEPLFAERGIEVRTGFVPVAIEPGSRRLQAQDGRSLDYDLLVMVPPHCGAPLARESGLGDSDGWIRVDLHTLRAGDRIFAVGDAAALPVPKSGAAAHLQAKVAARNILREIQGESCLPAYDGGVT